MRAAERYLSHLDGRPARSAAAGEIAASFRGRTALRPALVNWRIREEDVDGFVAVVRELAAGLERDPAPSARAMPDAS